MEVTVATKFLPLNAAASVNGTAVDCKELSTAAADSFFQWQELCRHRNLHPRNGGGGGRVGRAQVAEPGLARRTRSSSGGPAACEFARTPLLLLQGVAWPQCRHPDTGDLDRVYSRGGQSSNTPAHALCDAL